MSSDAVVGRRRSRAARCAAIALVGMVIAPNAAAIADVAPSLAAVGAMPRLPGGAVRTGALSTGTVITIGVALAIRRPEILAEAAAAAAADPRHGPHLTPQQFAALYGPSGQAVTAVSSTLRSLGLTPGAPSSNGLVIPVRSTVGQIERAFHARIDGVRLSSGSSGWAPESAPLLPSAVAPEVSAILGLANLTTPHDQLAARRAPAARTAAMTAPSTTSSAGAPKACAEARRDASSGGGWSDDQIAQAYGLDHLYARGDLGAGQTVAIFELEPFAISDVATFDRCFFGRSHASQVSVSTLDGFALTGQGDGEAILDVEDVSALAPAAKINVYEAPNTSFGAIDEYNAIVSDDTANIISTSWGECESALDAGSPGSRTLENAIFEEAALQGQTVIAASGDDGSDDCANTPFGSSVAVQPYLSVDDPASQPYVLAVGGTSLDSVHPPLTARDETVWNDGSTDGAAGGGISITWPSPAWQAGSGVPGVGASGNRQVPDVSAAADQSRGITVFSASAPASLTPSTNSPGSGIGWSTIGGTSSSAPIWAAILAEIAASGPTGTACSSLPVTAGGSDLGFVPPDLYAVARVDFGGAFHDVSRGNNDAFGLGHGYSALPGFDTASGLGSPIVVGAKGTGGLASDLCAVAAGSTPQLPPRPVISALAPTAGSLDGGNVVTITLASPVPAGVTATVQFGTTTAPVVAISGATITVNAPTAATTPGTAPFGGAGPVAVSVLYSGSLGVASSFPTATDRYEYVATASGSSVTPIVTGVGPSGGSTSGGGRITIYGSGFAAGSDAVTIGGTAAAGVVVVNDHEITATIPAKSATTACATGTGFDGSDDCQTEVVVTNSSGSSPTATVLPPLSGPVVFTPQGVVTSEPGTEIAPVATEYDYSPVPVITGITPNPASSQGNLPVTITGSGFSLTNFEWVNFGPAANPDSQQLKIISITSHDVEIDPPAARSSDAAPLPGGVSVSTFAGVSNVVPFGYAGIPVVRSLSTHLGPVIGGTRITISGTGLAGVTSVNFVSALSVTRFGQSTTRVITPLSHGRIRVVSPAGLVGPVDVEPCTPSGCASANPQHDRFELFSIARPQVSSISPQSGPAGGGSLVTIRGNNLAGAVAVWFGGTSTSSFTNANGFAPGGPDAIAVFSAPGRAGTTVPVVVVTRTGRTVVTQHLLYTYLPSGPSAPRRGSARNTPSGIDVVWKTPASNGGHPISGYTVTATATGGATVTRHVGPRVHQIVVSGVTPARSYNVVVRASNGTSSLGLLDFVTVT